MFSNTEKNPNWPSKVPGKKSGDGRGNGNSKVPVHKSGDGRGNGPTKK